MIARVRAAEQNAADHAASEQATGTGPSAAVVLASREQVITLRVQATYPVTCKAKVTYSGSGYRDGYHQGTRADIDNIRLGGRSRRSLR